MGDGVPGGSTDYELSLGRIVDTLRSDYPAFFERSPDFEIYDDGVVLELGQPFHSVAALRGKRRYIRALGALQRLAGGAIIDGVVNCRIYDGTPCGYTLRVPWTCKGEMLGLRRAVHVSAVSLYSVVPQAKSAPVSVGGSGLTSLSHRIHRHTIEFVQIEPPSLRSLLLGLWWQPQLVEMEPTLAFGRS